MKKEKTSYQKKALLLILLLGIAGAGSLAWILSHSQLLSSKFQKGPAQREIIADIYQNGQLLDSISLSDLEDGYTFTVTGEKGAVNQIEVRPGSIGIISASCPDKLCVQQGFINTSLLPVTCLPNRLVIQIRTGTEEEITPDIVTY